MVQAADATKSARKSQEGAVCVEVEGSSVAAQLSSRVPQQVVELISQVVQVARPQSGCAGGGASPVGSRGV